MVADGQYACCQLHRHQQRQHRATLAPWSLAWWRDARGSGTAPLSRTRTHAHTHKHTHTQLLALWLGTCGASVSLCSSPSVSRTDTKVEDQQVGEEGTEEVKKGAAWNGAGAGLRGRGRQPHTQAGIRTDGRRPAAEERERERDTRWWRRSNCGLSRYTRHTVCTRARTHTHGRSRGCVWRDASSLTLITAQSSAVIAYFH